MKRFRICLALFPFLLLCGCWDSIELTDRAFIMGVAVDTAEEEKIRFTIQFYEPVQSESGQGGKTFGNITVENQSVAEAVRDFINYLGRKAQWSHMRAILVGEELARQGFNTFVDFFYRDSESRLTTPVLITKGEAKNYLEVRPYIENTIAQQIRKLQQMSAKYTGITQNSNLLTFGMSSKSEVGLAYLPYISFSDLNPQNIVVTGVAALVKGKLADVIPPDLSEYIMILNNRYRTGVIRMHCPDKHAYESVMVNRVHTDVDPVIRGEKVTIDINTEIQAHISVLKCTSIVDAADDRKFADRVAEEMKANLERTLRHFQEKKLDIMKIGDQIYRKHPRLWKEWKKDWPERFSRADFNVDVQVIIRNHGIRSPKPALRD